MKIIEWPQFLENGIGPEEKLTSMTIGIFDGVHLGHRALIERIVSHNINLIPVIITFRQNHKTKNNERRNLLTFQKRLTMFEKLGIQITIVIDFTEEFKRMPGIDFLNILLKHGRIGFFAAGYNFRCGNKLDTDADSIKIFFSSHSIPAEIVPQVTEGGLPISSSRIRSAVAAGDLSLAQTMLGYAPDNLDSAL